MIAKANYDIRRVDFWSQTVEGLPQLGSVVGTMIVTKEAPRQPLESVNKSGYMQRAIRVAHRWQKDYWGEHIVVIGYYGNSFLSWRYE